jgi:POT family proton-dependent oligopeptide transporter
MDSCTTAVYQRFAINISMERLLILRNLPNWLIKLIYTGKFTNDLAGFATTYLDVFSRGYNWAFAIAAAGLIISLLVYLFFYKSLPNKEKPVGIAKTKTNLGESIIPISVALGLVAITAVFFHYVMNDYKFGLAIGLFVGFVAWIFLASTKEEKPRVSALALVYVVVIFFWMSFHQNGLTLTFFARDYTVKEVNPFTFLFFNLDSILCVILTIVGLVLLLGKNNKFSFKLAGLALTIAFGIISYLFTTTYKQSNPIAPEVFQSFNPLFIVALTPLVMGLFATLNKEE